MLGTLFLGALWLVAVVLIVVGVVFGAAATGTQVLISETQFLANPVANIALLLGVVVVAAPFALLAAWLVQRRPAGTLSSVAGRLRWRWLLTCFAVALPTILAALLAIYLLPPPGGAGVGQHPGQAWVGWQRFLLAAVVLLALVPLQSAAEEYVFRGWIIQTFGAYLRWAWIGILVGSVAFAFAHGLGTTWGFADLMLFGVISGWLTVRTGGLEPAIALHTTNNLLAFLLSAAFGSLAVVETAAQASWLLLAVDVVLLPLYALVLTVLAGRRGLARTVPSRLGGSAPQFGAPEGQL